MDHWSDYVIFVLFLCMSMGIGIYHALSGGRQRTTEEFVMADRKLKVLPTTISMLVSYQSAIMILGGTAEIYTGGVQAWLLSMFSCSVAIVIVQAIFAPWFYKLQLKSVYKYFYLRYGTNDVRILSAILGVFSNILYMGTATLAPSVALETATGFPMKASIPIMALVCLIYTSLGGMKAVIWTDVFQFLIMISGMLAVLIKGYLASNGLQSAFQYLGSEGRLIWADWSPDPRVRHTFWGFLIGYVISWTGIYGIGQPSVQRFCAVSSLKNSRLSLLLNIPCLWVMQSATFLTGITVVAYFISFRCDPILGGSLGKSNELLPHFVKEHFINVRGFSGLFLATLYSGALSSVSSSLSGSAANTWEDIIGPLFPNTSDRTAAVINKILVIIFGVMSIGISFVVGTIGGPITQVSHSIGSACFGPKMGLFLLAGVRKFSWCSSKAATAGGVIGFLLTSWLTIGANFTGANHPPLPPLSVDNCTQPVNVTAPPEYTSMTGLGSFYSLSYIWFPMFGILSTIFSAMLVSGLMRLFGKSESLKGSQLVPDTMFITLWPKKKSNYDTVSQKERIQDNALTSKEKVTSVSKM